MPEDQRRAYIDAAAELRQCGGSAGEEVAEAIAYLAGATFVTGTVLECTGGLNLTAAALEG